MGQSLDNTKIKETYVALIKTSDNQILGTELQELSDGDGNDTGISINTGGDLTATGDITANSFSGDGSNLTGLVTGVSSVNTQTGDVVLDTDDIDEGTTNLWYSDSRVSANSDVAANTAKTGITSEQADAITANTAKRSYPESDETKLSGISAGAEVNPLSTDELDEGTTNLYYTSTRANADFDTKLAASDTDDLTEGVTNLYYTDERVASNSAVSANTAKTGITSEQASAITANTAKRSYPTEDETKLDGIEAGAQVNVQADWNETDINSDAYINNKPSIPSVPVTSVNTQTGDVVLDADDIDDTSTTNKFTTASDISKLANIEANAEVNPVSTDELSEGSSNLYYTEARVSANTNVVANTAKNSYPTADATKLAGIEAGAEVNPTSTDELSEGSTNLYYTEARVSANTDVVANTAKVGITAQQASDITANNAKISFDSASSTKLAGIESGAEVNPTSTDELTEGTSNLYYTDARVSANTDVVANSAKNSYPSADATKLAGIESGAEVNPTASEIKTSYESNTDTNAFTDAEKTKLSGIASGAEVNVNADWNATSGDAEILNKPTLFSGSYNDLTNKPTIPAETNDLSDVSATAPTNGQVLQYNSTSSVYEPVTLSTTAPVDSVNGQTGAVSLDADDISDASTTNKFTTASDITKLSGIEAGAEVNPTSTDELSEGSTNLYYTDARVAANSAVAANTAKVGITTDQANAIVANTAKNSYPSADATKVGYISVTQAVDLDTLESDVATNNAKVGITTQQASDITANNAKISFDSASSTKLAGIEANADVTDATNVQAAGALMDSEVDADIKTLSLPANTTISTFGASLVDDADAAAARTTLGVDAAGTDNSTNVTLSGTPDYITISGQTITRNLIDLSTDVTGTLPVGNMAATALTTVQTAASESAQLALTTQEGDVVVRTDENKTYMRNSGTSGTMADFTLLATPTDAVTSVNGNTGAVTVAENVTTNLSVTANGTSLTVNSSDGTNASIPAATTSAWGAMTDEDKSKLNGIAAGAQVNPTNTDGLTEGSTNLYYTDARVAANSAVAANTAKISFDSASSTKLAGIATGAEVNVQSDWNATSGDALILNKPSLLQLGTTSTTALAGDTTTITTAQADAIAANTLKVSNVTTDLSVTASATGLSVNSSDGTDASLPAATTTTWGVMTDEDKSKLDGISSGAEVNVQSDWNATSGDAYIANKPTIPTNNNQLTNGAGYITASSTNTLTNKSGAISQWTNDAGYTTNVGDITSVTAGTNLTGGGTSGAVTLNMATGGVGAGTYGSTANGTKIDTITVDAYGRVTGVATGATGAVTGSGTTNYVPYWNSSTNLTTGTLTYDTYYGALMVNSGTDTTSQYGTMFEVWRDTQYEDGPVAYFYNGDQCNTLELDNYWSSQKAISFKYEGFEKGSIVTGTSSVSYNTTSDYRLKENVAGITDGIDRLKQLNPSRFNFIGETDTVDGFLAHEVQDIVPEAVTGEKDGTKEVTVTPAVKDENGNITTEAVKETRPSYQAIDQAKLVPLLTAALQEAVAKIESLEARIQTLENA